MRYMIYIYIYIFCDTLGHTICYNTRAITFMLQCIKNPTDINIPFILFKMSHYLPKLVATATGSSPAVINSALT